MLALSLCDRVVIISAPANTIILGEHAVLHGYPALACALQQRLWVALEATNDGFLWVNSQLTQYRAPLANITDHPQLRFVLAAARRYRSSLTGLKITIHSDFSHTLGLGSSAAITVAMVAGLEQLLYGQYNLQKIMCTSLQLVRYIQGSGSGCDLAASAYGGLIAYQTDPVQVTKLNLSAIELSELPPMALIYSGYKTPTSDVIAQVAQAARNKPKYYAQLYKVMGRCVELAIVALQEQSWSTLAKHINHYHHLLQQLGVSDATLDRITDMGIKQYAMAAKVCGSGLGDCVFLLGQHQLHGWNQPQLALRIDSQGLRQELDWPESGK